MKNSDNNKDMTKRQVNALKTKDKLYKSAMGLFKSKGYYNVSVDEIVKKAGTSKGSFYTHFKSKDQVMKEHSKRYDELYIEYYEHMDKSLSPREKILGMVENMYKISTDEAGFDMIYVIYQTQLSSNNYNDYMLNEDRPLYKIMIELFIEGQEKGSFTSEIDPIELTKLAVRSLRATYYEWCLYNGEFSLVEEGVKYMSIFLNGISE